MVLEDVGLTPTGLQFAGPVGISYPVVADWPSETDISNEGGNRDWFYRETAVNVNDSITITGFTCENPFGSVVSNDYGYRVYVDRTLEYESGIITSGSKGSIDHSGEFSVNLPSGASNIGIQVHSPDGSQNVLHYAHEYTFPSYTKKFEDQTGIVIDSVEFTISQDDKYLGDGSGDSTTPWNDNVLYNTYEHLQHSWGIKSD